MRPRESLSPIFDAPKHVSPWSGVLLPRGTNLHKLAPEGPEAMPGLVYHRISAASRILVEPIPTTFERPPRKTRETPAQDPPVRLVEAEARTDAATQRYNLRPRKPRAPDSKPPASATTSKVTKSKRRTPAKSSAAKRTKEKTTPAKTKTKTKTPAKGQAKKGRKSKK
ncbi:hypothetical protein BDZ85DRAFT_246057 [Elsinoe ampelina]|uniref:Uncharacterized protein n=1 Tax=Elsinoe ampelina TaxID=302913 RepID=A0A6A6GP27_9PEZI|nr:hypothetical protein BDZ85DRAFT_246057 [Elsinoe ampelina]